VAAGPLGDPDDGAWLDVAVARVWLGRVVTPWLATGALSLDGARHPLGGPGRWRGTRIAEGVEGCDFVVPGRQVSVRGTVRAAAYELGMREHDHGIPLQPFPDGPAQSSSSPVQ
jgi:hypothetical protein